MADSGKENAVLILDKKYQGGKALPFIDHDFIGTTQLNSASDIGGKFKSLLVKLYAAHGKDMINIFSEKKQQLKVENFPKTAKGVKDLLDYNAIDGHNKISQ
eukprot:10034769-Ditylum_brightwellii.AAC.1